MFPISALLTTERLCGMTDLHNDAELQSVMNTIMGKVFKDVLQKIEDENQELIMEIVYYKRVPKVYPRTYEFAEAWSGEVTQLNNETVTEFGYDPAHMTYDPDFNIHGSLESGYIGKYLAEIILEGKSGNKFGNGWWREERDTWAPLLQIIDANIDNWVIESLNKYL